jgi:hypothetical protein
MIRHDQSRTSLDVAVAGRRLLDVGQQCGSVLASIQPDD